MTLLIAHPSSGEYTPEQPVPEHPKKSG